MISEQVERLLQAAEDAYDSTLLERASDLYGKAASLARTIEDRDAVAMALAWQANCRSRLGRLQEALTTVMPVLPGGPDADEGRWTGRALMEFALCSLEIPVPLAMAERVITEAEQFLHAIRDPSRREGPLLLRAFLAYDRGQYDESFSLAKEALAVRDESWVAWSIEGHYDYLVKSCVKLGDADRVLGILHDWEESRCYRASDRRLRMAIARSRHALLQRNVASAVEHARDAVLVTTTVTSSPQAVARVKLFLLEALIAAGDIQEARECLVTTTVLRRSESLIDRYKFALLRGDFYLSVAQRGHDSPIQFPIWMPPAQPPSRSRLSTGMTSCRPEILRVARCYAISEKLAAELDGRLACDRYTLEVRARRAALDLLIGW